MPYALRHTDGRILSLHRNPEAGSEFVPAEHPDVQAFLGPGAGDPQSEFARLDADVVRVLEDLIDVLIARQVLRITDLPVQAQEKLYARKSFRDRKPARALRLYGDGDDDGIISTDFGTL
ncbi:hypothetical protein [Methylibium sp.]|uniref:hypothetical protein n=1 Tax=Methylibium sp. TaxID=2067992 RepID=UPI003D0B27A9